MCSGLSMSSFRSLHVKLFVSCQSVHSFPMIHVQLSGCTVSHTMTRQAALILVTVLCALLLYLALSHCASKSSSISAQVETTLIKVEPTLFSISPKGVNVEGAVIEVSPKLISVSPEGSALNIELPGHIHIEGSPIEVAPVGEDNDVGPGADRDNHDD